MGKVWYGSLNNRLEENKMFCDEIKVGTGVTEYFYSDRQAYEVIEVINQKHVFIRRYDHELIGEPMSNDWKLISNPNNPVYELVYRYNGWYSVTTWTKEKVEQIKARDGMFIDWNGVIPKLEKKPIVKTYRKMNVSFGHADYHYDYEF